MVVVEMLEMLENGMRELRFWDKGNVRRRLFGEFEAGVAEIVTINAKRKSAILKGWMYIV